MASSQALQSIQMQPRGVAQFTAHGRQRLSYRAGGDGFVWLTRDGDIKDYWLGAGDSIQLCPGDRVWLTLEYATRPASLVLEAMSASAPPPLWRSLAALLAHRPARRCEPASGPVPG
jgi:hypothetical protein